MSAPRRPVPSGTLESGPDERSSTLHEIIQRAGRELAAAGVDAPRLSAELLAAKAFGLTRLGLILQAKDRVEAERLAAFHSLVARRAAGEPVAYLLGEKEFFGLAFRVTPDVLIPRPETECIIEEVQRQFRPDAAFRFADFGTGSGALAVTLAHEFQAARGIAVDLSSQAARLARQNAEAHQVSDRLLFLNADFTRLALRPASLDLVAANPPYVTEDEYAALSREVRAFEPRAALVSPGDGLWHLRGLLPVARHALRPGGLLLCELGSGQGDAALELAGRGAAGFEQPRMLRDYAGLDRILALRRNSQECGGLT